MSETQENQTPEPEDNTPPETPPKIEPKGGAAVLPWLIAAGAVVAAFWYRTQKRK